ncbi:MAG: biopolymer transport protein ExbD [Flavobacteriaceae bacterium]|jgi:biopolymer transport protein ExbD|uniref:ExbD/TolR family protein n=1 Tax=Candidatus Marifrigoribacter sp. Uisw_064 TaxID=3230970 RepID=UPI003ADF601B
MRNKNTSPQLNAGGMADIAFLLLIFFLVSTTIPNDKGIARILPPPCKNKADCLAEIHERNILRITTNDNGELLIANIKTPMNELRSVIKEFIDNNKDASCTYCQGKGLANSSDNPNKASISLNFQRNTPYKYFIQVQNELTASYNELREEYSNKIFQKKISQLTKDEFSIIKEAYPYRITEADIK